MSPPGFRLPSLVAREANSEAAAEWASSVCREDFGLQGRKASVARISNDPHIPF